MVIRRKVALQVATACFFVVNVSAIGSWVALQNIFLTTLVFLASMPFDMFLFYLVMAVRRKPRYPLVPPEGIGDMYLPRTNIPRPLYEDFHKMKERKRKFAKIDRMVHKRSIRKKKSK